MIKDGMYAIKDRNKICVNRVLFLLKKEIDFIFNKRIYRKNARGRGFR
jgi:hypothetical protein